MSVNAAALRKGPPPKRAATTNPITADDRRPAEGKTKPLQLMVPPNVFDAFSEEAGRRFGYRKGGKSKLFLAMWHSYVGTMVQREQGRPPSALTRR